MSPALKRLVIRYCEDEFNKQVAFLKEELKLDSYDPKMVLTSRASSINAGGDLDGEPFIWINYGELGEMPRLASIEEYPEYPFIEKDPVIGSKMVQWKEWVARRIAHELSHTLTVVAVLNRDLRDQVYVSFDPRITKDRRPHGKLWQEVYRRIVIGHMNKQDYSCKPIRFHKIRRRRLRKNGREFITYYIGRPIAYQFIKEKDGSIWRCDRGFTRPRKTAFKDFYEVRRWIMSRY